MGSSTGPHGVSLSPEIPSSSSDPFIQRVLEQRSVLLTREKESRADAAFLSSLSPIAQEACAIVDRIRRAEEKTTWAPAQNTEATDEHITGAVTSSEACVYPGMAFPLAKARLESTNLWKIVRRMPKGSLLHAHMDATVEYDYLIRELLSLPGIHVKSDRPLKTCEAKDDAALSFCYRKQECVGSSVWEETYEPGAFRLLTKVAESYPEGGREGFIGWLKSRCMLSSGDSYEHHHGVDAIWVKFAKCFLVVGTIIHYEPMFRKLLRRLMSGLKADGVNWAELRITWPLDYCRDKQEEPEEDYTHMFQVFEEEQIRFKASPEGQGFWGLRIIWSSIRFFDTRTIMEDMSHCIATKAAFPNLIAGYDLVGAEDLGRPLVDLLPELSWFTKQCAEKKVNLPFFFHAGETLGDGNDTDGNLFDAIILGTRRIGHGFSLYKHPLLIKMVKERSILIESCPISNEVLRLCGSVLAHPLPALLARGVACSLCNDDPAMLGHDTPGLSHDFFQALQGWGNLGLAGLGSMARDSVLWSAFEDQTDEEWVAGVRSTGKQGQGTKSRRLGQWEGEWEEFCTWIVNKFGEDFPAS